MNIRLFALPLLAASLAAQQFTSATIEVASPNAQGCQSNPGLLTGDVAASATVEFTYDRALARLTMIVTNTSPIVAGEENPQITDLMFNAPRTVTGMALESQSAAGPTQPAMNFSFDSGARAGCFGSFRSHLATTNGIRGAIANASAPLLGGPEPVPGPVTFVFSVTGDGVGALVAESFAHAFGTGSNLAPASVGMKFQAAGLNGEQSGFLANGGDCLISFYTVGEPRIGSTIEFCQAGPRGCHDCLWFSLTPGPVTVAGIELPIGLPLLFGFDFGQFGANQEFCQSISIPNDPMLIGLTLYFAVGTFPVSNPAQVSLSSAYELTVTG
ncbi:MAG: hypothetical protein IPM29_05965 [Planctomycetes bacterium]|nr:hypothetical protein [Planctomycetota bacterium]